MVVSVKFNRLQLLDPFALLSKELLLRAFLSVLSSGPASVSNLGFNRCLHNIEAHELLAAVSLPDSNGRDLARTLVDTLIGGMLSSDVAQKYV